jgi:beta-glucanase (GH16 family)
MSPRHQQSGLFVGPLAFAIVALGIGALVGLGGYFGTRSGSGPHANQPKVATVTATTAGGRVTNSPTLPPPGSHLAFNATFTGTGLDARSWTPCFWYALPGAGCTHLGAYPEQEWYLASQDQVYDGALHLVASPVSTTGTNAQGQPQIYPCRSGMVTTDSSFDFTYGYVQVVAQLPKGTNMWPALWMLPANNAEVLPEIDLMEIIGTGTTQPLVSFHPATGPVENLGVKTADLSSGWHTFGLDWEPGSLTWYIDGSAVFAVTAGVPTQPMYFLANLAVTNAYQPLRLPSSCTGALAIRSVQVWQSGSQ